MKTYFLDTNLFIRYLTDDDPPIADRVDELLTQATEGKIRLVTDEMEKMGIEGLYSFDKKHLSTIKGIRRLEP